MSLGFPSVTLVGSCPNPFTMLLTSISGITSTLNKLSRAIFICSNKLQNVNFSDIVANSISFIINLFIMVQSRFSQRKQEASKRDLSIKPLPILAVACY